MPNPMAQPTKAQLKKWVEQIRSNPYLASTTRNYQPRVDLAKHADRALPLIFAGMRGPFPNDKHPRDVTEALAEVLDEIAKRDPAPLVEILQTDALSPDPEMWLLVHALGSAKKKTVVNEPLIAALKHENQFVRSAAASSLIKLKIRPSLDPLFDAICDRASDVTYTIVEAVNTIPFFQDVRAIPKLKQLLNRKRLPVGTKRHAEQALKRLEEMQSGHPVTELNFSWKQFGDRDLAALPDNPHLQSLDLSQTQVADKGLKELSRFPNLRVLDLNNTRVTSAGIRALEPLKQLETLAIGGVGFDGKAGLAHLAHLPKLTSLDLGGTSVQDAELIHLKKFPSLKTLSLFFHTGDAGLRHVAAVKKLRGLRLYDVPITDAGIKQLAKLNQLHILSLEHCQTITDAACETFKQLNNLEVLDLRGTPLSHNTIKRLKKSLSACEIKFTS